MTEKRFKLGYVCGDFGLIDNDEWIDLHSMSENSEKNVQICINKMNELSEENEQLKSKNRGLQSELQIFKEDITHSNLQINKLTDENEELKQQLKTRVIVNKQYEELQRLKKENEQLKKDATILIYANQDYRQQNLNLQEELDYIQNSITNAIKHQKTELGVKALQEIIADYNEWMLGHKEAKE